MQEIEYSYIRWSRSCEIYSLFDLYSFISPISLLCPSIDVMHREYFEFIP